MGAGPPQHVWEGDTDSGGGLIARYRPSVCGCVDTVDPLLQVQSDGQGEGS